MKEEKKGSSASYCGPRTDCEKAWGTRIVLRGPVGVCVTATEAGTDEDCEAAGRIVRIFIDHYMKRPSLRDEALMYITHQCGSTLYAPSDIAPFLLCDMAALLFLEDQARFFVSGGSRVRHFVDGELVRSSRPGQPLLGSTRNYVPALEDPFPLQEGENAFLLSSPKLDELVSEDEIREALLGSVDAEGWLGKLVERTGGDAQFCAAAVFMGPAQPAGLRRLLRRKPK